MSEEVIQALKTSFEALSKEDRLRAIFLKANGKNFSAGGLKDEVSSSQSCRLVYNYFLCVLRN